MAITYKKAGVDISEIKKSQRAIGKLIESTHNLQKMAKMTHGFWSLCRNCRNSRRKIISNAYRWCWYKSDYFKYVEKI